MVESLPDVEGRSLVGVHKPHVVAIGPHFQLTGVGGTLEGDSVGERSDCSIGVLPG